MKHHAATAAVRIRPVRIEINIYCILGFYLRFIAFYHLLCCFRSLFQIILAWLLVSACLYYFQWRLL